MNNQEKIKVLKVALNLIKNNPFGYAMCTAIASATYGHWWAIDLKDYNISTPLHRIYKGITTSITGDNLWYPLNRQGGKIRQRLLKEAIKKLENEIR